MFQRLMCQTMHEILFPITSVVHHHHVLFLLHFFLFLCYFCINDPSLHRWWLACMCRVTSHVWSLVLSFHLHDLWCVADELLHRLFSLAAIDHRSMWPTVVICSVSSCDGLSPSSDVMSSWCCQQGKHCFRRVIVHCHHRMLCRRVMVHCHHRKLQVA